MGTKEESRKQLKTLEKRETPKEPFNGKKKRQKSSKTAVHELQKILFARRELSQIR
jgi:hypothetical protein